MSTRTRTITWHDPLEAAGLSRELTGLEFLHRISSGLIAPPPVAELVGFGPVYVMPGRVVFEYEPREEHYNPLGSVHGGILTTVLDTVMGCAVQSLLDEGVGYATIELKTSFVRPVIRAVPNRLVPRMLSRTGRTSSTSSSMPDAANRCEA